MTQGPEPRSPAQALVPPRRPAPTVHRRDFMWGLLKLKQARNYMEIGVREGATLARVECPSIGVDPTFAFDRDPVGRKPVLHLYQKTSDDFFRDHDPRAILGSPVDVVFLDGMHLFEYLLRDFMNAERCCDGRSMILLDDCLPANIEMTEREWRPEGRKDPQTAGWWTGDVWKVVEILRAYRPDLRLRPVDVFPNGVVIVTRLDPGSTVLRDRYEEIVARFRDLELTPDLFERYWTQAQAKTPFELDRENQPLF